MEQGGDWAIILAAGEGTRLRSLTTDSSGVNTPKQFCSFAGGESLLRQAIARAKRRVSADRIVAVVAEGHRRWWLNQLSDLSSVNIVVQPRNRGTAAGLLLPLLNIVVRDREARTLVLPSDHVVASESNLALSLDRALTEVADSPERVILLGMPPEEADPGFGWVVPEAEPGTGPYPVAHFVEKPAPAIAKELMASGGLINSFILAAHAQTLVEQLGLYLPDLVLPFLERESPLSSKHELARVYRGIPEYDVSRDLLQPLAEAHRLFVLRVTGCGWCDLGTPERIRERRRRLAKIRPFPPRSGAGAAPLDLAALVSEQDRELKHFVEML